MNALYVSLGAAFLIIIIYHLIILWAFRFAFHRKGAKPLQFTIPEPYRDGFIRDRQHLLGTQYEEISIISHDGLRLVAELKVGSTDKTVILFHGYRGSLTDLSGAFRKYDEAGYNIIMPYQRAHGKSEGRYITFGIKEGEDCALWAKYADQRFGGKILLGGISMGATTVLCAADKDLPASVVGIAADCGFSTPYDVISHFGEKAFHLPPFIMPIVMSSLDLFTRLFGGFTIKKAGAPYSLSNATVPVAITHGEDDQIVPCEMSKKNAAACASPVCLYTVKGADHGMSHLIDPSGCFGAVENHFITHSGFSMFSPHR